MPERVLSQHSLCIVASELRCGGRWCLLGAAGLPPGHSHHERQHRHGRDGVADEPEHGDGDVQSDRRLGHVARDEHGKPVLPLEYRKADVQRRHLEVERRLSVEHVCGMLYAPCRILLYRFRFINLSIHLYESP